MMSDSPDFSLRKAYGFFLTICLLALLGSFLAQYVWKLQPCNLCIMQRIPYVLAIALCLWGIFSKKHPVVFRFLMVCFAVGLLLSLYHLAVQYGFIRDRCKAASITKDIQVFEDLLLRKKGCGEISWVLFGLPIPFHNALLFSCLGFAAHFFMRKTVSFSNRVFSRSSKFS